jgi:hypothetical protein
MMKKMTLTDDQNLMPNTVHYACPIRAELFRVTYPTRSRTAFPGVFSPRNVQLAARKLRPPTRHRKKSVAEEFTRVAVGSFRRRTHLALQFDCERVASLERRGGR